MKANELRIGNLVYCWNSSDGKYETVISINWKHIRNRVEQPEDETYKLIPLTKEWLIKFRFEIKTTPSGQEYIQFGSTRIYFSNKFHDYFPVHFVASEEWCPCMGVSIYFVHQLQNLYFALTGVELQLSST